MFRYAKLAKEHSGAESGHAWVTLVAAWLLLIECTGVGATILLRYTVAFVHSLAPPSRAPGKLAPTDCAGAEPSGGGVGTSRSCSATIGQDASEATSKAVSKGPLALALVDGGGAEG